MRTSDHSWKQGAITTMLLASLAASAQAQFYINEIYFDPPGGLDAEDEYIELRGTPNASLADHYLIFLESESSDTGSPGGIDNIFDLGEFSFGSNGFLALRQNDSQIPVNPNSTNFTNEGPGLPPFGTSPGFGNGEDSTIGASDDGGEGIIENGAFSALLIRNDSGLAPTLDDDLDTDDDGNLDNINGAAGWMILDSIGEAEPGENNVKFYAAINYNFSGNSGATVTSNGQIFDVGFELEYLGRWGNSVGSEPEDWHVSNLTNSNNSGFQSRPDYRVSTSDPQPPGSGDINTPPGPLGPGVFVESNKDVPFGLPLTDTLGAPNFITGDFNDDGVVDAADYTVWRDTVGDTSTELDWAPADPNRDFIVDEDDYLLWEANYGTPVGGTATIIVPPSTSVPEPSAAMLTVVALMATASRRSRRSK